MQHPPDGLIKVACIVYGGQKSPVPKQTVKQKNKKVDKDDRDQPVSVT